MVVRVLSTDPQRPDPKVIRRAVEVLRRGGIVALPTETLYGLAADPAQFRAIRALVELKGRPTGKPFPILVSRVETLSELVPAPFPAAFSPLAEAFWPGPLTLVLAGRETLPEEVRGPSGNLAVRVTSHPVARALIEEFGGPVTGTSANPSGRPEAVLPETVERTLGDRLDLLLDAGPAPGGPPSTIVDLTGPLPRILRRGAVPAGRIQRVLRGRVS